MFSEFQRGAPRSRPTVDWFGAECGAVARVARSTAERICPSLIEPRAESIRPEERHFPNAGDSSFVRLLSWATKPFEAAASRLASSLQSLGWLASVKLF